MGKPRKVVYEVYASKDEESYITKALTTEDEEFAVYAAAWTGYEKSCVVTTNGLATLRVQWVRENGALKT